MDISVKRARARVHERVRGSAGARARAGTHDTRTREPRVRNDDAVSTRRRGCPFSLSDRFENALLTPATLALWLRALIAGWTNFARAPHYHYHRNARKRRMTREIVGKEAGPTAWRASRIKITKCSRVCLEQTYLISFFFLFFFFFCDIRSWIYFY